MQGIISYHPALSEEKKAIEAKPSHLDGYVEQFLASLDVRETTKEAYGKALRAFEQWRTGTLTAHIDRETILNYKRYLIEQKFSPLTVTAYLTALRRFFAYLEGVKAYPDVTRGIKGLKRPRGFLKESLTRDEVVRLLESIDRTDITGLRDYALINLLVHTGLRTIEAARATIGDISREGGETVLRVWGKGRDTKDSFVILTGEAYEPILDYLKARGNVKETDPLFLSHSNRNTTETLAPGSISRIIATRLKTVGLKTPKITAHSLRHTSGTIALMNGADLLSVKDMLRHSNINTTLVYVHNINRIAKGAEKYISFGK